MHQDCSLIHFSLLFLEYPITFLPFNMCVPYAALRLMSPLSPRLSPFRGTSERCPLPPQPCSGDATSGENQKEINSVETCQGLFSTSLLACSHFGAQMLNSAVGTLLAHLSYLKLRNTSSTYSHTNTPERSFRPNGLHTKKQDRQAQMKTAEESITSFWKNKHLFGKIKGFFFSLTLKYCVVISQNKGREWKIKEDLQPIFIQTNTKWSTLYCANVF